MIFSPPSWLEISTSAFDHNISQYKRIIGPSNILAPVIKSNAYGHGLIEIGRLCELNNNIGWLCVVKLSEATTLRANGITKPILMLGFVDKDPAQTVNMNIEYACSDFEQASYFSSIGQQTSSYINLHIKVDTGLARFGTYPDQVIVLIKKIQSLPYIKINGIWSHFAESHNPDQAYTRLQLQHFNNLLHDLKKSDISIPYKHMSNSAAITNYDLQHCNLFRVGLGIYGYWPSEFTQNNTQLQYPDFTLKPVATWKTRILHIKSVPAGHSIGYDRTVIAQENKTIALLPVGYENGYSSFLSNKGFVGIAGDCAPTLGRVAMNIITIDITHIKDAYIGQEVTLLGNHHRYNAEALADATQINNPRFITTNIKADTPKVIVD